MGSIYKRGRIFWVKYYIQGHCIRESSRSQKESEAKRLLAIREGDKARGKHSPLVGNIQFSELIDDLMIDYQLNNRKSIKAVFYHLNAHVIPYFGELLYRKSRDR